MKLCPKCNETKSLTEFHTRSPNAKGVVYPQPYCKPCTLLYNRGRAASGYRAPSNLNRTTAQNTRTSWLRLLKKKGITEDQYNQLIVDQGGRCAICPATSAWSRSDKWHVDHCHTSGKVRGLLCSNCNTGLGQFKDDTSLLEGAIAYLKCHNPDAAKEDNS